MTCWTMSPFIFVDRKFVEFCVFPFWQVFCEALRFPLCFFESFSPLTFLVYRKQPYLFLLRVYLTATKHRLRHLSTCIVTACIISACITVAQTALHASVKGQYMLHATQRRRPARGCDWTNNDNQSCATHLASDGGGGCDYHLQHCP